MAHPSLVQTDHRPWPVPAGKWTWRQSWKDLLFAHWPVDAEVLRPLVPPSLSIQEFDGTSWVGVVPFRMSGVMRRPLPDLPWVSAFPELNLRLYVERHGRPGVWFLSLDATNPIAVWSARRFFHLPYYNTDISIEHSPDKFRYRSSRTDSPAGLTFEARYGPTGDVYTSQPGSLEHWLTERYCLYAQSPTGELFRTEVHHKPWPLQPAHAEIIRNEMGNPHGLTLSDGPTLIHFSHSIDVVVWNPVRLAI